MTIVGPAQDILPLETMILGVLSGETTRVNDGTAPHLESIRDTVRSIVTVVSKRPIYWFGARHWRYDDDARISKAAFDGGASEASTDAGAATVGKKGIGTIPHALECIYGWKYGYARAVVEAAKAFDAIINPHVPRIALVDFNNKEIDDSLACARELGNHLSGVRVDTCGENTMQHASPISGHELDRYWSGTGVTVSGVYALRKALNENGFSHTHIILSSGFGEIHKIHAFLSAEKKLHIKLFDALGIGEVFPVRSVTMDIVSVGQTAQDMIPAAKIGRGYTPNARLKKIAVYSYEGHPDQSYVE
jgi:nicotinate phosphoribosyltransferase